MGLQSINTEYSKVTWTKVKVPENVAQVFLSNMMTK